MINVSVGRGGGVLEEGLNVGCWRRKWLTVVNGWTLANLFQNLYPTAQVRGRDINALNRLGASLGAVSLYWRFVYSRGKDKQNARRGYLL